MTATATPPREHGLFGPDFYPTPPAVAAEMLDPLDLRGRTVLEPSAGSGNLLRECMARGAAEVLWCEPEHQLRAILAASPGGCMLSHDFLQVQAHQVSHIDLVVMNPPFSADEAHILHAWDVAPPGCEIVSLCNWKTLDPWRATTKQAQVAKLIDAHGSKDNLGSVFDDAERTTQASIGLVRLTKPGQRVGGDEFDGFFLGPDDLEAQGHGLIPYRRSRDIVNRYVEACRIFDEQVGAGVRLRSVLDGFFGKDLGLQVTVEGQAVTRNRFRKDLQKAAWKHVFDEFLPQQMATSQLSKDINSFVEKQSRIPFTERNLYRMLQIVAGTHEQRIDRAVEEAIDNLTRFTKDNRYGIEGWATNAGHMLNSKFICSGLAELAWSEPSKVRICTYGPQWDQVRDLIKALCFITGRVFEEVATPERINANSYWPGDWYDWGFFEFRPYKKGTVHFRFKSRDDWAALNRRYAQIKGQSLPEKI
jgi:predicted RNA methylase